MRRRVCRFLSSTTGVASFGAVIIMLFMPFDWLTKLVVFIIVFPIMIPAISKFYGNQQLWDWPCARKNEDGSGGHRRDQT